MVGEDAVALDLLGAATARIAFLRADKTITYDGIMQTTTALRSAGYVQVALVGAEGGDASQ